MPEKNNPVEDQGEGSSWAWWTIPIVGVLASYISTFTAGFVWDDHGLIVQSPLLSGKAGISAHFLQPFWSNALLSARSFYRPLVTLSYALDHAIWGVFPGGFHLTNLLLHLVSTVLLVLLCRRAGAGRPVACLLATVFALFPRLTESVAWISGRTDVMAAGCAFGALLLFRPGLGYAGRRIGAGVALFAGLLCKEVAVAAAVAMAVWCFVESKETRSVRRMFLDLLPIGLAMAVYAWLRMRAMGTGPEDPPKELREPLNILLAFGEAQARYVWMLLDGLRPRLQIGNRYQPDGLLSFLGIACLAVGVGWVWRMRSRISTQGWMALGLGGTALFLVSHVIYLDVSIIAADRFLYVPFAALMIGISGSVERAWQAKRRIVMPVLFTLISLFALTTSLRSRLWGNELALWRFEEKSAPSYMVLPRIELVVALYHRGRYDEALAILDRVPMEYQYTTSLNKAACLDKLEKREDAVALLETMVATETHSRLRSRGMINLMLMYARAREFSKARKMGAAITAHFSDRQDIRALVEKVAVAESEWVAFPAETEGEPLPVRVARAAWFAKLGALPEAQARFARIAKDPSVDEEVATHAVSFLVFEGRKDLALETLSVLSGSGRLSKVLPSLRSALEDRFDDGD